MNTKILIDRYQKICFELSRSVSVMEIFNRITERDEVFSKAIDQIIKDPLIRIGQFAIVMKYDESFSRYPGQVIQCDDANFIDMNLKIDKLRIIKNVRVPRILSDKALN